MSLAFGTTDQITANVENITRLPGKATTQITNVLKRPALGEIGNTLNKFAVPGRIGLKKTQPLKSATFTKEPAKFTRVDQAAGKRQLKHVGSSSSLFSVSHLKEEPEAGSTTAALESCSTDAHGEIEDVDKDDMANPYLVAYYAPEIYRELLELEKVDPIKPNFLAGQNITSKMRAVLVDWLIDVQGQYKLLQETLFLNISIVDRYLQRVPTNRRDLQLVGVAALFLAGKYEEIYFLDVAELVSITDNAYTKKELLKMEKRILKELDFSFGKPLSLHFLRRFSKVAKVLPIHHNFSKYFLEWSLIDYELCHIRPSRLAAAALFIARCIYGTSDNTSTEIWNRTLQHYSGVPLAEVQITAVKMAGVVLKASQSKHKAIGRKYSEAKLMKVSQRPELTSDALKNLANGILP